MRSWCCCGLRRTKKCCKLFETLWRNGGEDGLHLTPKNRPESAAERPPLAWIRLIGDGTRHLHSPLLVVPRPMMRSMDARVIRRLTHAVRRGTVETTKAAAPEGTAARWSWWPRLARDRASGLGPRLVIGAMLVALAVWNAAGLRDVIGWARLGLPDNDWSLLATVDAGNPYATGWYKWSIPAAWAWAEFVVPLGLAAWSVLKLAAIATLPWRVALLAAVSYPFWEDVVGGNLLTFVFVAAWHAVAGQRWAVVAFCILAALVPRPVMLPVLAWLLWRSTTARVAFGAASVIVIGVAVLTSELGTWLDHLAAATGPELAAPWNVGPSRLFGVAWVPVGIALAIVATWRGHLGVASLCATPYVIHYYALLGLLELQPLRPVGKKRLVIPLWAGRTKASAIPDEETAEARMARVG